jgi:hypothetical protein
VPRDALFDLAVNRAASYLARFGLMDAASPRAERARRLGPWYSRTRFVYRIPVEEVLERLGRCPGPGYYWQGGEAGGWQEGDNPRP